MLRASAIPSEGTKLISGKCRRWVSAKSNISGQWTEACETSRTSFWTFWINCLLFISIAPSDASLGSCFQKMKFSMKHLQEVAWGESRMHLSWSILPVKSFKNISKLNGILLYTLSGTKYARFLEHSGTQHTLMALSPWKSPWQSWTACWKLRMHFSPAWPLRVPKCWIKQLLTSFWSVSGFVSRFSLFFLAFFWSFDLFSLSFYMFFWSPPIFTGLHLSVGGSSGNPALITSSVANGSNDRSNAATEVATFGCHRDGTWHLGTRTHYVSMSIHAYKIDTQYEIYNIIWSYVYYHLIFFAYFDIKYHTFSNSPEIALAVCILGLQVPAPSSRRCT